MNQIAAALPKLPSSGANVGPSTKRQILAKLPRTENAEPHDRQNNKVDARHGAALASIARGTIAIGVDHLADVTGCRFERRRGKADQIETRHHRRDVAEPAGKR